MALTALAFSGGKDSMACLHLMRDRLDCAIFVDTGFSYPEAREMVNRRAQNEREGIPADLVPIDWTPLGQQMSTRKPITIQSYLQCHYENISAPLWAKAQELGVTHLMDGQRREDFQAATKTDGELVAGIKHLYPIKDWSTEEVLAYLATKMTVPDHYYQVTKESSLDCYDCPAFERTAHDRLRWTAARYPERYAAYLTRRKALDDALREALLGEQVAR